MGLLLQNKVAPDTYAAAEYWRITHSSYARNIENGYEKWYAEVRVAGYVSEEKKDLGAGPTAQCVKSFDLSDFDSDTFDAARNYFYNYFLNLCQTDADNYLSSVTVDGQEYSYPQVIIVNFDNTDESTVVKIGYFKDEATYLAGSGYGKSVDFTINSIKTSTETAGDDLTMSQIFEVVTTWLYTQIKLEDEFLAATDV